MLTYNDLSKAQRKWVDLLMIDYLFRRDTITFDEINEFHRLLFEKRNLGKEYKVGYPNWLLNSNRVSRGTYKFPKPVVDKPEDHVKLETEDELRYRKLLETFELKGNIS